MALYAFDGTWNEEKSGDDPAYQNTNVVRFRRAYEKNAGAEQFYRAGVGTRYDFIGAALGGVFGLGELPRIQEAYTDLQRRWADGDFDIDIVGFSRGAATALDFCHYIQDHGLPGANGSTVVPQINFLGLFDTVAAFGLANLGNEVLNFGHHLTLPPSRLKYCFHALALDERRLSFLPTRLPGACEVWFRGVHSDIGGGNGNRKLNDYSLRWMMRKAMACGLPINEADIDALQPAVAEPQPHPRLPVSVRPIAAVDRAHYSVTALDGWTTPPATCPIETVDDEATATALGQGGVDLLPQIVRDRMRSMWSAADTVAKGEGFTLDHVQVWLLTLIESRVLLVQSDADLTRARSAMGLLVRTAIDGCRRRDYHVLMDFFLNEALFGLPHLFPLTD